MGYSVPLKKDTATALNSSPELFMSQRKSETEIQSSSGFPPVELKTIQIIWIALGMGVLIFTLIVLFFYFYSPFQQAENGTGTVRLLSYVHIILAIMIVPASSYLYRRLLHTPGHQQRPKQAGFWNRYRNASIIRLVMLEGLALYGLTICFIAITSGILSVFPVYWLNIASALFFELVIFREFPTKEKIETLLREEDRSVSSGLRG